jgi:1-aminocyclopropane-1-carboxylate deaminase/D-cysteine desulfhydrase-like pyridoxal-dependent ACC family enzyme
MFSTPSPLTKVPFAPLNDHGITLLVKRDDLIHPDVSGNKWRKLRLNIEQATSRGNDTLLTFGGAHSNHIAATAAAGKIFGLKTIGIIRAEDADLANHTLAFAARCGMHIHRVSRSEFRQVDNWEYRISLKEVFGNFYLIPQGGAGYYGVQGCQDILKEIEIPYHRVFVGAGTGTTLSGMALANKGLATLYGVSALKGGAFLIDDVRSNIKEVVNDPEAASFLMEKIHILDSYHFGGYARIGHELIDFMRRFTAETGIKLDPVYTAKTAFAMSDLAAKNPPAQPETWVLIHTGGLQGIPAMEAKNGYKIYP